MSDSADSSASQPQGSSSDSNSTVQSAAPSPGDNSPTKSPPPDAAYASSELISSNSSSPPLSKQSSSPPPPSKPTSNKTPPSESSTPPPKQQTNPPSSPPSPSQEKPSSSSSSSSSPSPSPSSSSSSSSPQSPSFSSSSSSPPPSPPPPSSTSSSSSSPSSSSSSSSPPSPSSSSSSYSPPSSSSSSSSPPSPPSPSQPSTPQQLSPPAPKAASEQQSPPSSEKHEGTAPLPPLPPLPQSLFPPPLFASDPHSSSSHNQAPQLSLPSTGSKAPPPSTGATPEKGTKGSVGYSTTVGVTAGFVCVVAFFVMFCIVKRRKKRREQVYIPQQNLAVQSDAHPIGVQQAMGGRSGGSDGGYHSSQVYNSHGSGGSPIGPNNFPGGAIESGIFGVSKTFFSYEELMELTGGFSRQNILGEGGFGCVYKGWLPDGKAVAVKQLKAGSGQGDREFRAEVEIISRVHHRHLVSLVGYCISEQHRLLIYEFVPNKTLEHHLHGKGMPVLEWTKRVKIALGSAKGLAYLHEDCHPKIIHRDIKSANILLDDAFEAQVADFGLAKLNDTTQTHVSTRVMGTFGYLAPEYASSGKLTDRSDVFSFGVVLLELITGRKPVDPNQPLGDESLVEWARPLLIHAIESRDFSELVDPRLEKQYVESQLFRMIEAAAASVRHSAAKRPRMAQVVRALDMEEDISDLSNGVKYGQSTAYDSGQYNQDIKRFRQMALDSDTSSEYNMDSEGYSSREMSRGYTSGDSETPAINPTGREAR